jgi:hypothetical protein
LGHLENVEQQLRRNALDTIPDPAPIVPSKDNVPYIIAGTLKEAELVGKTREHAEKHGQSTFGKQRSASHLDMLGPGLLLDDDGDVFVREAKLREFGVAAGIYSSYSYGFIKGDAAAPAKGGRVVLTLNRQVSPSEYDPIWNAILHLLGGGFDVSGRPPSQCYGQHARRSAEAPRRRT